MAFGEREELLEQENRQRAERLAEKVASLKNFTLEIEHEAKEHNKFLDGLQDDFLSTEGFLGRGLNRVNRLLHSGRSNKRFMCYLSLALCLFLFFIYFLISHSLNSHHLQPSSTAAGYDT